MATNRNKITFELSRATLALLSLAGVVALLWMFVFGVFIGRRYSPDTYIPARVMRPIAEVKPQPSAPPRPAQPSQAAVSAEAQGPACPAQVPAPLAICQVPAAAKPPAAEQFASEMARHKEAAGREGVAPKAAPPGTKADGKATRAATTPKKQVAAAAVRRTEPAGYAVQVGAFAEEDRARAMVAQLEKAGYRAYLFAGKIKPRFRVRLGPYTRRQDAERAAATVGAKLGIKPYLLAPGEEPRNGAHQGPGSSWRG